MHKEKIGLLAGFAEVGVSGFVLVFFAAAFAGVVLETLFVLVTRGVWESRTGMVLGPFNQVYGIGAVLLTLVLAPVSAHGRLAVFLTGAVVGGLFETVCSLVQEKAFGTVSWRYAGQPLALFGGRTSVLFMVFWGVLGLVYIEVAWPLLVRLVTRVPHRAVVAAVVGVFLCLNLLLSALAVNRWNQRQTDPQPQNPVAALLDRYLPDERMEKIYPSMKRLDDEKEGTENEYPALHRDIPPLHKRRGDPR